MSEILKNPEIYPQPNVCFETILQDERTKLMPELVIDGEEFGLDTIIDLSDQATYYATEAHYALHHTEEDYAGSYEEIESYLGIYVPSIFCHHSGYRYILAEKLVYVPAHTGTQGTGYGPHRTVKIAAAYQDTSSFSERSIKRLIDTNRTVPSREAHMK